MAELVNLRMLRKAQERAKALEAAAVNAAKHGRSKAEKTLEKTRAEKAARDLDAAKRE
jgi:hypothetical protein